MIIQRVVNNKKAFIFVEYSLLCSRLELLFLISPKFCNIIFFRENNSKNIKEKHIISINKIIALNKNDIIL